MNLPAWAVRNGVVRVAAYRWFHVGLVPAPARRVGRLVLLNDAAVAEILTSLCARSYGRRAAQSRAKRALAAAAAATDDAWAA
ncbi:hypothetical protein AB0876_32665 [Mycobacterium sp. NPDC049093]